MSDDVTSDTEQASKDGTLTDMVGGACAPAGETLTASDDVKPTSPLGKTTSTLSGLLGGEKFPKSDSNVKENVPCKDDHVELSNKKKRSPCPWQIQPPPRPFKKARYAWQIKNYEHTVSRMKKSLAQQNQASSMGKGSSCSDVQSETEDSKHCASSASHYPGLYNNLPAAYSSSFYNPLLRWSKTASAASGVDIPVNRMLHNIFFSGNEPTSGLHPLLMMSLAEGNTAAFNENLACEDLPRDGAPLLLSDVPSGIGGVGSPGMQSPPTSDYDSSSDEASLGDDLMPEPQMMSHLPPSYPAMQQQQQHLMNSPQSQHYLSNAQSAHQQMLHQQQQNTLSCAQFPHMNGIPPRCDSPMDVPMNRRMTHVPDDPPSPHLHYEHHSPDHSTPEANLAFHNAMMNCPLSMTNRQLFSLQLHNFCERMQASNNFFPFNQSYQQYRNNCARISEYVDEDSSVPTESSKLVIEKDTLSSKADDQELAVHLKEDSGTESNVNKGSYEFRDSPAFYGGEKNLRVVGEHNSTTRVLDSTDDGNESMLPEVERSVKKSPNETSAGVRVYETHERKPSTRSHVSVDAMQRTNSEVLCSDASTKNLHAGEENVCPKVASEEAQKSLSRKAMSEVQKEFADTRGKIQEMKTRSSNEDRTFSTEKELLKSDLLRPRGDEISERKMEHRSAGVQDVSATFGDGERLSPSRHQRERGDCVSSSAIQNTQADESNNCEKPSKCESENRTSGTGFSLENDGVTDSAEEVRGCAEDSTKCDNSPVLKCKLEAGDDTGDSCSLASFSPKCLNCVSGCDDCSRNLSDKTLEPPNSRLTLLTCSCVIAKQCSDDASIAPTGIASSVSPRESVDRSLGHCDNLIEVTSQSSKLAHKKRKTGPLKEVHCSSDFDECSCSDGSSRIRSCCSANKVSDSGKVRQAQPNDSHVGSADEKSSSPTDDSADTKVSDKTASALVHHICDNNNDKYFLDQTFHVAIKQGLGYQKA